MAKRPSLAALILELQKIFSRFILPDNLPQTKAARSQLVNSALIWAQVELPKGNLEREPLLEHLITKVLLQALDIEPSSQLRKDDLLSWFSTNVGLLDELLPSKAQLNRLVESINKHHDEAAVLRREIVRDCRDGNEESVEINRTLVQQHLDAANVEETISTSLEIKHWRDAVSQLRVLKLLRQTPVPEQLSDLKPHIESICTRPGKRKRDEVGEPDAGEKLRRVV